MKSGWCYLLSPVLGALLVASLLGCTPSYTTDDSTQIREIAYDNGYTDGYDAGYAKGKDFRYNYSAEPYFKLLSERYKEKIFRIELIYLAKGLRTEDITNLSDVPVHSQSSRK